VRGIFFIPFLLSCGEVASGFGAGDGANDGGGIGLDDDGFRVGGGELEAVEEDGGAFGVDAVACECGDEKRDGDLNGFGVFDGRQVELDGILGSVIGEGLGRAGCRCRGIGVWFNESGAVFDQMPVATVKAGVEVTDRQRGREMGTGSVFRWF
jgi:hypothetical protein